MQIDGATYGGWYRLLADGQMELLALANMHSERRSESSPLEQARGMLTDFIRAMRSKPSNDADADAVSLPSESSDVPHRTLGDLLYADKTKARVGEKDWMALVRSSATGDVVAFHGLFERTHHLVFTLICRLTCDRIVAEELTLDAFQALWRTASGYQAASGSVVAWVMNQARATTIAYLTFERPNEHESIASRAEDRPSGIEDAGDVLSPSEFLWKRLAQRMAIPQDATSGMAPWQEPMWEEAAPGISCKLLATDAENGRVSMLVRLAPGTDYPPHTHADVEELHLLHGELTIDARKLHAGDYNRAEPGTEDKRVWSATGCTCALITSFRDVIG